MRGAAEDFGDMRGPTPEYVAASPPLGVYEALHFECQEQTESLEERSIGTRYGAGAWIYQKDIGSPVLLLRMQQDLQA
jgi:hypothetical protein